VREVTPGESRSGEFEERKKGWKKCACFVIASGTLAGKFKRKYRGENDWEEARTVAKAWEGPQSWDSPVKVEEPPASQPVTEKREGVNIEDATESFLATRKDRNLATSTISKYRTFVKQLFPERAGCLLLGTSWRVTFDSGLTTFRG
jgi:hypothetical protein